MCLHSERIVLVWLLTDLVCIGLHLAKIELRLGAARFFKAFPHATLSSLEGMSDEDMFPELFFLISPQGHRCLMDLH